MPRSSDLQKVVGNIVVVKVLHVTSMSECSRRYGANKLSKILKGVVVDATTTTSLRTNQTSTTVTADYNLSGGTIKRATMNARGLKAVLTPTPPETLIQTTATSESIVEGTNDNDSKISPLVTFLNLIQHLDQKIC